MRDRERDGQCLSSNSQHLAGILSLLWAWLWRKCTLDRILFSQFGFFIKPCGVGVGDVLMFFLTSGFEIHLWPTACVCVCVHTGPKTWRIDWRSWGEGMNLLEALRPASWIKLWSQSSKCYTCVCVCWRIWVCTWPERRSVRKWKLSVCVITLSCGCHVNCVYIFPWMNDLIWFAVPFVLIAFVVFKPEMTNLTMWMPKHLLCTNRTCQTWGIVLCFELQWRE